MFIGPVSFGVGHCFFSILYEPLNYLSCIGTGSPSQIQQWVSGTLTETGRGVFPLIKATLSSAAILKMWEAIGRAGLANKLLDQKPLSGRPFL